MLDFLYNTDLEKTVLSTFVRDNEEYFSCDHYVELFTEHNIHIYGAIKKLLLSSVSVDIVTLTQELKGVVSASYLVDVVDAPVSAVGLEYHVASLENARLRRNMYHAYVSGIEKIKIGENPLEIELEVKSKITDIETNKVVKSMDLSISTLEEITEEVKGGKEIGIKTGIRSLDNATNGFYPKEFIVIAGRPGSGKTSILLNMVRNFGFFYEPGIIFSLEMPNNQLMKRIYCDIGSINGGLLFQNRLKETGYDAIWNRLNKAAEQVAEMPILFDDQATITIDTIYSRAKKAKLTNNIKWIAIDHLGLIKGWNQQGQEPKAEITRMCKAMSKDLDCSVIVLSQMNREIEKGKKRNPVMSDLRDAGSIEQDADIVLFPSVPFKNKQGTNGDEYDDAELFIAKTRRGWVCKIDDLKWQGHYFRYSNKDP